MTRGLAFACLPLALVACQARVPLNDTAVPPLTAATQEWAIAVSSCDVQRIVRLYDPDAVVWDMSSRTLLDSTAAIRAHYERICAVPGSGPRITLGEQRPRVLGATAVNAGTYQLASPRPGEPAYPVRFSFAYRLGVDGWRIVDHHASAFPPPAR